jgi:myo-inositol-1(or 4)-monophosphatase
LLTDADVALAAAKAGAAVVRARYGYPLTEFAKSPTDFATDADLAAEAAILEVLQAERPTDAVLGEETGATGEAERTWLVDPLCGTLNFAAQTPLLAVNVALRVADEITVAAVVDPIAGDAFSTDGRLAPSGHSRIVDINVDPPFPNGDDFRAARLMASDWFLAEFRPRVISSTLALAWVAAGRRAGYLTDGHLRDSVHFAAGIALCQAAGCTITDLEGRPLHTGAGGLIAAADAATHALLLEMVAAQIG